MPFAPEGYDRSPLTAGERTALALTVDLRFEQWQTPEARQAGRILERLARPIANISGLHSTDRHHAVRRVQRVMYREMLRLDTTFWEWSPEQWLKLIGCNPQTFAPGQTGDNDGARATVRTCAYLFGGMSDLRSVGITGEATPTAYAIFGKEEVRGQVQRVMDVLAQDGYSVGSGASTHLRSTLSLLFLLNRDPRLEHIAVDDLRRLLDEWQSWRTQAEVRSQVHKVARALWKLDIIAAPEYQQFRYERSEGDIQPDTAGVAPEWVAWCLAWREQATGIADLGRADHYRHLLAVGRWLARTRPDIVSPQQWDEGLAGAFVTYACSMRAGDDVPEVMRRRLETRGLLGRPVVPSTIDHKLQTMRRVFADWQDKAHAVAGGEARRIPVRFKPGQAFQTPKHIQRLIQPNPRDIDQAVWWKLMRAAATLTEVDLAERGVYPLSFVSAVALLWVTAARRPNEIARLRVGCIRRDWDPGMLDESGVAVEQDGEFTYLQVPSGKYRGPFWVPIPSYTADAVEKWERQRPSGQPPLDDRKDKIAVDLLFCYRGRRMGEAWMNTRLIPLLCRKAQVPESDARGAITAHRGRSTTATLLRKAGVSLDDISTFLGHTNSDTVRHYARVDPFQHARAMRKADDLLRVVEGLLDPQAAARGKPAVFFYLGYGPDQRPHFCGNPGWEACPHRLACQQCQMYVDAQQAEELERREGVIRFEAKIPMLPEERALADGDAARMREIVRAKQDIPVPVPPGPNFVFNPCGDLSGAEECPAYEKTRGDLST